MGTYPPRECGIATFNQDLLTSSQKLLGRNVLCKVVAMNLLPLTTYSYPKEVEWQLDQNNINDHLELAEIFNANPLISGVILQHEYGIYGGVDGENILQFMEACIKPIIVTLHTVLPNPSDNMKRVTQTIIKRANIIIVLTNSSKVLLESVYPESLNKVQVIPHGIHQVLFSGTFPAKKALRLEKRTILSTFGLLSRGKGIEYVIKSLPYVVKNHPEILYLILGQTHPIVRREEGESYRTELVELVKQLKLENHVRFYDQYLNLSDLFEYLKATDVYISSSINPNQAVSGTLSYALGTGRAVISTKFAQAKEIINKDSGILVPIEDSRAYADALNILLKNKNNLKKMNISAYEQTRVMLWSNVAKQYWELLKQNILPDIKLDHLWNMTDDFGLFQFANLNIPDKKFGYTLDDNARALIICNWLKTSDEKNKLDTLINIYLHFIERCQLDNGVFINYIDFKNRKIGKQNSKEDLEDCNARAMWALAEIVHNKYISVESKSLAKSLFVKAIPNAKTLYHIRSSAFIIKAFALFLQVYPEFSEDLKKSIKVNADNLIKKYKTNSIKSWKWFDSYLGYNNAIVPESLLIAGQVTSDKIYTAKGKEALNFLIQKTFSDRRYMPIGHSHWYKNNEKRSSFDQQPEDPASMILALVSAYEITHDYNYQELIHTCFSWFMGNNSLQLSLYNHDNGGCYDGLHPDRINKNQGAESLVSYLLSRISVSKILKDENINQKKLIS